MAEPLWGSRVDMVILGRYTCPMRVNVAAARNKLSQFLKAVEDGESVTICRRGVPVADLVRTGTSTGERPKFGTLRGKIVIHDPEWWKPMGEEEIRTFSDGRR